MKSEAFKDRVWLTHKARIEAEKRLRLLDFLSELCLVWTSLLLVVASYFSVRKGSAELGEIVHILSVFVLVIGVFIAGRKFGVRAHHMRNCYEELGALYTSADAESIPWGGQGGLAERYAEIIKNSENHSTLDYYLALVKLKLNRENISKELTWAAWLYVVIWGVFLLFVPVMMGFLSAFVCWLIFIR